MKALTKLHASQSDILASNKKLTDSQSAQFTELNKSLESLTKEVSELKLNYSLIHNKFNSLETRFTASEKAFSEAIKSPSSTTIIPTMNDITCEIQLRSQYAKNIIIRVRLNL